MAKLTREDVERIVNEARKKGQRPDLSKVDLTRVNLSGMDLMRADLTYSNLMEADFRGANLGRVNFTATNLRRANLSLADIRGSNLSRADLIEAILIEANLAEANLNKVRLTGADLMRTNFSKAKLILAKLSRANLIEANLIAANLGEADLVGTNLSGSQLTEAYLIRANLTEANLTQANLSGADLRWTNLTKVRLEDTDFLEATIGETIFVNVDLNGALNLETIQHKEPSMLDINTIYQSQDKIPKIFLEQAGVHPDIIRWQHSLHTLPTVFICYSHKDEAQKDELLTQLSILSEYDLIDIWDDTQIPAGEAWEQEIIRAITRSAVAILLVSANFLTSRTIKELELPQFFECRKKDEDFIIYPIIAKPCPWKTVDWLTKMQVRPQGGRPIWGEGSNTDEVLAEIANEITEIVRSKWLRKKPKNNRNY